MNYPINFSKPSACCRGCPQGLLCPQKNQKKTDPGISFGYLRLQKATSDKLKTTLKNHDTRVCMTWKSGLGMQCDWLILD